MNKLSVKVHSLGAMAMVPYSKEVAELLTKKDKFGEPYQMYEHKDGQPYMMIPRGLVSPLGMEHDFRSVSPVVQSIALKGPRNADQARCIDESLSLLQAGVDHIAEAPTGFGKTYLGAEVANRLGQRTLVIVTKNDLVQGWKDTFAHLIGCSPKEIGHIQQDTCDFQGCRYVVAMIHSLICREYDPLLYRYFGLVIFDEVHRLGADHFIQAAKMFPAKYRLGLSATPERSDGREQLFQAHIGPVLVKGTWVPMKPKILVRKTGWKVPLVNRRDENGEWKRVPMEVIPGRSTLVHKEMAKDPARNQEIVEFVQAAYKAGRRTLVLSTLIDDHLKPLFFLLTKAGIPGEDIGYYIGGQSKQQLDVAKNKRVILATFKMTGEGTDVPIWDSLVLAVPLAKVKQAIGRVMRDLEGKNQPVALDLVDNHPTLQGFYYSRLKEYYSVNADIVEV